MTSRRRRGASGVLISAPQVTDHRGHVTSPGVPRVLGGEIEVFVDALIQQDADERVAAFEASS